MSAPCVPWRALIALAIEVRTERTGGEGSEVKIRVQDMSKGFHDLRFAVIDVEGNDQQPPWEASQVRS